MSAFNNNNSTLDNNTTSGLDGRASNLASTGLDTQRHQPGQLNENHGIAATGLNEPHTHATVPTTGADNLNYSGAPIADTRKVDQQAAYGNTAGLDNPSHTNRTGGTGIPPVNTAEHVRRNAAEEAIAGRHGEQNSAINDLSGRGHHHTGEHNHHHTGAAAGTAGTAATAATADAIHGDHGASHHDKYNGGIGLDDKARLAAHDATHTTHHHHPNDPVSTGSAATTGQRHARVPLHEGLAHGQKHAGDHHNATGNDVDGKPSAGDKIKGNLEKIAGKITGNEAKVIKGENIAQGRSI